MWHDAGVSYHYSDNHLAKCKCIKLTSLYTLNLYNVTGQLYRNKAGETNKLIIDFPRGEGVKREREVIGSLGLIPWHPSHHSLLWSQNMLWRTIPNSGDGLWLVSAKQDHPILRGGQDEAKEIKEKFAKFLERDSISQPFPPRLKDDIQHQLLLTHSVTAWRTRFRMKPSCGQQSQETKNPGSLIAWSSHWDSTTQNPPFSRFLSWASKLAYSSSQLSVTCSWKGIKWYQKISRGQESKRHSLEVRLSLHTQDSEETYATRVKLMRDYVKRLSETSQRKTNTVWSHLYVESKKNKPNS